MVAILAAGKSTRMESSVSKCAMDLPSYRVFKEIDCAVTNTVGRLIVQLSNQGEKEFVVVVGYDAKRVVDRTERVICAYELQDKINVSYVYNPLYESKGCGYSLSLIQPFLSPYYKDPLTIVEGDLVASNALLKEMYNGQMKNSRVAVRSGEFLSNKSVAVGSLNSESVSFFVYDRTHKTDFSQLTSLFTNLKESLQVWRIGPESYSNFIEALGHKNNYKDGISAINECISKDAEFMKMVDVGSKSGQFINVNTKEDLKYLSNCTWFLNNT